MMACSLCDKIYINKDCFYLYLCQDCHNKTSFCLNCDKIMMKIFENDSIFKCGVCRKITRAFSKDLIEITNSIYSNNIINLSAIKGNESPNQNLINENNIQNNNSFLNSPIEIKAIGNRSEFYTPSPFINKNGISHILNNNISGFNGFPNINNINLEERKNNDSAKKNEDELETNEINNVSNLTDINRDLKIKNKFHLITNNNEKTIIQRKKKLLDYFDIGKKN